MKVTSKIFAQKYLRIIYTDNFQRSPEINSLKIKIPACRGRVSYAGHDEQAGIDTNLFIAGLFPKKFINYTRIYFLNMV